MSVVRVHKNANFTVMSNYHFKEKKMSLKAKGLLSLMLSLPDDWDYSISGLATLSKDGKDSVMSALGELEKFGYLSRQRVIDDRGRFAGVEYNIFEQPQEKPIAEKPNSDSENSEKSNSEKPQQSNTNQSITNENQYIKGLSTKEMVDCEIPDAELRKLYFDYIDLREEMDAPLTPKGMRMLIDRCERLSGYRTSVQKAILETAIINNWRNVYAPKDEELKGRDEFLDEKRKFYLGDQKSLRQSAEESEHLFAFI